MEPEDVVNVLRNMVKSVGPGGTVLDLQVVRPYPVVEVGGRIVCQIEGESLLERAEAAAAAIDEFVRQGHLRDGAVDDHDVRTHYMDGAALVNDFADKVRSIPESALPHLLAEQRPCLVRERCRLRRLEVLRSPKEVAAGCLGSTFR